MNELLNQFFPNGLLIVMIMFGAMFALGVIGGYLIRLAQPSAGWAITAVLAIAVLTSLTCYSITMKVTEADMTLEELVADAPYVCDAQQVSVDESLDMTVAFAGNDVDDATPRLHH